MGILRTCGVAYGILGWVTATSAQFTAESLSDNDITQAIALLIEETMEDWYPQNHWDPATPKFKADIGCCTHPAQSTSR